MTSQAVDTTILMKARDDASAVFERLGNNLEKTDSQIEGMGTTSTATFGNMRQGFARVGKSAEDFVGRIGRVSGVISGLGLGALVGIGSIDALIGKAREAAESNSDFEAAVRRGNIQVALAGLSTDLYNERLQALERTYGRLAAQAVANNREQTMNLAGDMSDATFAASLLAKQLLAVYPDKIEGETEALALATEFLAGEYDNLEEKTGATIKTQKDAQQFAVELEKAYESLGPSIASILVNAVEDAKKLLPEGFQKAINFVLALFDEGSTLRKTISGIAGVLGRSFDSESPIWGTIKNLFSEEFPKLLKEGSPLRTAIDSFIADLVADFDPKGIILSIAKDLFWAAIPDLFSPTGLLARAWDTAIGLMGDKWQDIKNKASEIFQGIADSVLGDGSYVRRKWQEATEAIAGKWADVKTAAADIFQGIADTVWGPDSYIRTKFQELIDWFGEKLQPIRDFFSGIDLPDIDLPGFAQGGVVPGPVGAPMLAMVHGGETIIPPGGRGSGGGPSQIVIQNYIGERHINTMVLDIVRGAYIRAGAGPGSFGGGL